MDVLLKVPGIGPDTADRIMKMRPDRRITCLEDLGLRGKRLEKVKGYVVVEYALLLKAVMVFSEDLTNLTQNHIIP